MIATKTQARKGKKATINQRHKRYFPEHRYSAGIDGSDGLMDGKPCWGCLNSDLRSNSMNRLRLIMKNENYDLVLQYYLLDAQLAISSCAWYHA
jgi:hypothetical protein